MTTKDLFENKYEATGFSWKRQNGKLEKTVVLRDTGKPGYLTKFVLVKDKKENE